MERAPALPLSLYLPLPLPLPLTFCANRSAADVFSPVVMTAVTTGRDWAALLYQRPTAVKGAAMRDATDDMTREFALCRSGVRPGSFSLTQAATCRGQACWWWWCVSVAGDAPWRAWRESKGALLPLPCEWVVRGLVGESGREGGNKGTRRRPSGRAGSGRHPSTGLQAETAGGRHGRGGGGASVAGQRGRAGPRRRSEEGGGGEEGALRPARASDAPRTPGAGAKPSTKSVPGACGIGESPKVWAEENREEGARARQESECGGAARGSPLSLSQPSLSLSHHTR
jgi:hypothetical protein